MKIVRWIIIIIAAISVVGVGFGLLIGNADSTDGAGFAFWLVVGAIAVYFERRANQKKKPIDKT